MLSVAKLSVGQERYYLEQAGERVDAAESLGEGAEDYYLDPSEARGKWSGAGAARLGLSGEVRGDQLRALMAGTRPGSGESLREGGSPLGVAAYDLTFSAPKSVSVLFGTGDACLRESVRAAHDLAVGEALGFLERSAAAVRRGKGGALVEDIDGFVAAAFRHRSSRARDPQLHTHVVIANAGRGADGRWTALDGRRIYANATAASYVYQTILRSELTRELGLRWTPVVRGIAEVEGVPREVLRAFSRRRVEIERAMALRGTSGQRAAEIAALATRRAKRHEPERELFGGWRVRAEEFDWSAGRLRLTAPVEQTAVELESIVDALVGAEGLTAHASTFTRQDAIRGVCGLLAATAPVAAMQLEVLADAVLADGRVVTLEPEPGREVFRTRVGEVAAADPAAQRYSTTEMVELERRIVDAERDGRDVGRCVVPAATVAGALASEPRLSDEQRATVEVLCGGGDAIALVAGRAGTGKTFALATAREAWERSGRQVIGAAVARRAARELQHGAGIPSTSIAAMLWRVEHGERLPVGSVLVVDEASMLGTRNLASLVEHTLERESKLVLVGDPAQLPAVAAGGVFRALVERGSAVQLVENRRQVEGWERTAVQQLREGETAAALAMYDAHGRIHVEPDQDAPAAGSCRTGGRRATSTR